MSGLLLQYMGKNILPSIIKEYVTLSDLAAQDSLK